MTWASVLAATLVLLCLGASGAAAQAGEGPASAQRPRVDPTWLRVRQKPKRVEFQLIAGLTGLNGALNFNGFRDGGLTLTVPEGARVILLFRNNDGMLPHSAEVISDVQPVPPGPVAPAFDRAATITLAEGIAPLGTDSIDFVANRQGSFLIFCGVPGHGTQGMWIRFRVVGKGRKPTVTATPSTGHKGKGSNQKEVDLL